MPFTLAHAGGSDTSGLALSDISRAGPHFIGSRLGDIVRLA